MYKNILFAVELTHSKYINGQNIRQLADIFETKLSLIHIIEMPPVDIFPDVLNKESLYIKQARLELAEIGKNLHVPSENQHIEVGNPKINIAEFTDKNKVDLLIVGHHEREIDLLITNHYQQEKIYHLIGSTTQALLSLVKCAILILPFPIKS